MIRARESWISDARARSTASRRAACSASIRSVASRNTTIAPRSPAIGSGADV